MSLGIYPVLNPPVAEAKLDGLGEVLAIQFEILDELASEHGLTRFTAFADSREIPVGFDGSPEDLERIMGPWKDWFACRDGRVAFEALAQLVTDRPAVAQRLEAPAAVTAELRAIASVLAVGERCGSQFRLEMS